MVPGFFGGKRAGGAGRASARLRGGPSQHPPLEDAGVLPAQRHQVPVVVGEAHVGDVAAVTAVHVAGGLRGEGRGVGGVGGSAHTCHCAHTCEGTYVSSRTYVSLCMCVILHMYVWMHACHCAHTCRYAHTYVSRCVCVRVHTCHAHTC